MHYKTKGFNVKAVQWRGDNDGQVMRIIGGGRCTVTPKTIKAKPAPKAKKGEEQAADTPERRVMLVAFDDDDALVAEIGQWIVRGPQGEPMVLDQNEFKRRFEKS